MSTSACTSRRTYAAPSALRRLTGLRGNVDSYAVFEHVGTAFAVGTLLATVRLTEPR